jgi:hypothetical protein
MFIAKSTRSLSFSPRFFTSNCTWAKVLENLTVSKLNIFSSFIQPLSFLSVYFILFLLLYILFTLKNLNYQSFSVLLVSFTFGRLLYLEFSSFVHGIQRFSNRCLEIHSVLVSVFLIFGFIILVLRLFYPSLSFPCRPSYLSFLSSFFSLSLSCLCLCLFYPYPFVVLRRIFFQHLFLPMRILFPHQKVYCAGHLYSFNGLRIIFSFINTFPKLWYALCFEVW